MTAAAARWRVCGAVKSGPRVSFYGQRLKRLIEKVKHFIPKRFERDHPAQPDRACVHGLFLDVALSRRIAELFENFKV